MTERKRSVAFVKVTDAKGYMYPEGLRPLAAQSFKLVPFRQMMFVRFRAEIKKKQRVRMADVCDCSRGEIDP